RLHVRRRRLAFPAGSMPVRPRRRPSGHEHIFLSLPETRYAFMLSHRKRAWASIAILASALTATACSSPQQTPAPESGDASSTARSEEHTSELQSRFDIVCLLLLD